MVILSLSLIPLNRLIRFCFIFSLLGFVPATVHADSDVVATVVDFNDIDWYAQRAKAAYDNEADIRKAFPNTIYVNTVAGTAIQYFIEFDKEHKRQVITVRGTDNLANIKQDVEFEAKKNHLLGIYVHHGFNNDAYKVYQDLLPHLNKQYPVRLTGHSLGAAISTLLMMYLHNDHFVIETSVNFGQPKVTDYDGAEHYKQLPLLRVVDENDPVPLLPPASWFDVSGNQYHHFGREVILLSGIYYVYLNQHESINDQAASSIWQQLDDERVDDHRIVKYLKHISSKITRAEQVPFAQREHYIQK